MADYRTEYRGAERDYFWTLPRVVVALFAAIVLMGSVGWVIHLASQPARIVSKTFDADNIIHNYEWFHDAHGNYKARSAQVAQFKKLIVDESDTKEKSRLRIDLAAMQQSCRELAQRYNANADKANRAIFMRGVPSNLSAGACE